MAKLLLRAWEISELILTLKGEEDEDLSSMSLYWTPVDDKIIHFCFLNRVTDKSLLTLAMKAWNYKLKSCRSFYR